MNDSRIPFLIWTDAPDKGTGLARICRDLAAHIQADPATKDIFRIGTCGFFGQGSSQFPWTQYMCTSVEDGLTRLPSIWDDFSQSQLFGILFTITPPSWIFPLGCPDLAAQEKPNLQETWDYLMKRPFDLWSYLAIETHSPNNRFSLPISRLLSSIDRTLYYSQWGVQIAANSLTSGSPFAYIPHGIFCDTFVPHSIQKTAMTRSSLGIESPDDILIGCVATNTARKNLGLLFESFYLLKSTMKKGQPRLWLHTDIGIREWSIPALLGDFNLDEKSEVRITSTMARRADDWIAHMMSACDVLVLPTEGEGFGYPLIEALSCGTPIVTTAFGAQTQFLDGWRDTWICPYVSLNVHGPNNLVRPSYRPIHFAERILTAVHDLRSDPTLRQACRDRALLWDWPNIWPGWRSWLLEGIPAGHPLKPKLEIIEVKESSLEPL